MNLWPLHKEEKVLTTRLLTVDGSWNRNHSNLFVTYCSSRLPPSVLSLSSFIIRMPRPPLSLFFSINATIRLSSTNCLHAATHLSTHFPMDPSLPLISACKQPNPWKLCSLAYYLCILYNLWMLTISLHTISMYGYIVYAWLLSYNPSCSLLLGEQYHQNNLPMLTVM